MKFQTLRALLSAVLLLAVCSAPALAVSIPYVQTRDYTINPDPAPGAGGYYFSFDTLTHEFDRWAGPEPLASVQITVLGRHSGSFFVGNATPVAVNFATAQQNLTFFGGSGPDSLFDVTPYDLVTDPGPLPQPSSLGMFNLVNGDNPWQINGVYTFTDPGALAYFTGASPFSLQLNNLFQIGADGGTVVGGGLLATGDITVSMTPVPEPSSLALLALGLGAVGGWVYRRRR